MRHRLRRRHGHARRHETIPNRADLIAALGLSPEGSHRGDKYAATTKEFWRRIKHGTSRADVEARRKLGLT